MNYDDFDFFNGLSKEEIKEITSTESGRKFLEIYFNTGKEDNQFTPENVYNNALEKSLKKEKVPLFKRIKVSEDTKNKILATILLIILLLSSINRIPGSKEDKEKASTSYSEINEDNISRGGRK